MKSVLSLLAVLVAAPLGAELKVGDPAPALKVERWVKGDPVKLADGKDKTVYVVEFWATWCPPCVASIPHLSKLQKRFEKSGVVFVGVSIDDAKTRKKVDGFVKDMGEKMSYRVALDDDGATGKAFMDAAGVRGIPHAFLVGKDGKIAWHGHPMEDLDLKVAEVVGDKEYVAQVKKVNESRKAFDEARSRAKWDDALKSLDDLIKLDPDEEMLHLIKYHLVAVEKKDKQAAEKLGPQTVASLKTAESLNQLSWAILTDDDFDEARDLKLALSAAKKANEITGGKKWDILDTYARALFETGSRSEALSLQRKAVELAKKEEAPEAQLDDLKESLERYEKADGKDKGKPEKE